MDKSTGQRIVQRIGWLSENLDALKPMQLKGELRGLYKLRQGDYRIINQVLRSENLILIHAIGHRREIYKKRQ